MSDNEFIIRPEMRDPDVQSRGQGMPKERLASIKKGLHALHTLELMATNIYKFQLTRKPSELNRQLAAAMCNEMTHYQDFQTKLYEYGFKPSKLRGLYWMVGFVLGFGSRLLGPKVMLKVGIWVETKAVHHYKELLETVDWDDETRKIVEKDRDDEFRHIHQWEEDLAIGLK